LDRVHLGNLLARDFAGKTFHSAADNCGFESPAGVGRQRLAGGKRLPGDAVEFALALLDDYQDCVCHDLGLRCPVSGLRISSRFSEDVTLNLKNHSSVRFRRMLKPVIINTSPSSASSPMMEINSPCRPTLNADGKKRPPANLPPAPPAR